jgi:UDP-GlcNAc:undecaprenyl-phosphate GlcNAc-1-phosphate transferase
LIGFLPYNASPARIFLGDSGSLLIGFTLPILTVHAATRRHSSVLALVPLLVLALPLTDTSFAILRRWLRGVPIFRADRRHLHHQLLALGCTHRQATRKLCSLAAMLAGLALLIALAPASASASATVGSGVLALLVLFYASRQLDYHEFSTARSILASAVSDTRRAIRARIQAQDLAEILHGAESFERLNAILDESASKLGFRGARVWRTPAGALGPRTLVDLSARQPWRVDYCVFSQSVVTHLTPSGREVYRLTVWGDVADMRSAHSLQVISILAGAIAEWVEPTLFRGVVQELPRASNGNGVALPADIHLSTMDQLRSSVEPS